MDDWRLTNQEKYLKSKKLIMKHYSDRTSFTEHDHCEFCLEKFGDNTQCINIGYCTEDSYYWICPSYYNDFKEFFQWEIINLKNN